MIRAAGGQKGFTLLELVAVVAIFSVVAMMSLQILSSALAAQRKLSRDSGSTDELVAVTRVLRRDIVQMAPVLDPDSPVQAFRGSDDFGLSFVTAAGRGLASVTWWRNPEDGALHRSETPLGEGETVDIAMLDGVDALTIRVLTDDTEWIAAHAWDMPGPIQLPRAVEVTFRAAGLGDLRVLVAR